MRSSVSQQRHRTQRSPDPAALSPAPPSVDQSHTTFLRNHKVVHPVFFLLDGFPPDQFSTSHLFALHILLMAARKIITVNWMKVHQPTLTEWTQRLNQIYIFEKMTADLQLKSDMFQQTWALMETDLLGL